MKKPATAAPSGYALSLGNGMWAALHADGRLTLADGDGEAELSPAQVEKLAELLAMGGNLRGVARRRRARQAYLDTYAPGEEI